MRGVLMNGILQDLRYALRQLRKSPVHKVVPILVLTTESDKDKKMVARDAGATGWMVKPFDPENLIATIRKVCP